ncbi:cupredoxin domain-containing protein [Candidatus Mycolicibacterium alkanivorans]|uniref:Cupredoxin domain-containing protein n=1 Tax=Candidatus Mycolicibacterium alkanivorans TaxID=2954114 RepID=A0ABS9YRQ5_9MYCO|nr:cupredoxin domain-containing protein [Candidatus Mycolicibacterium alkanivorans]MCI4673902.1 cupredoxin domain-containing protein [Candidatus Mycolicibacterium alkanivorans]
MTRLITLAFATLLFVTGCSSGITTTPSAEGTPAATTSAAPAPSATAAGPTISIADMKFGAPLTVTPGATVTVVNSDGAEHTVTADSGNAFNAEVGGKGTTTFTAPSQPGTYAYHCTYHPMMHGQLIVQ